MFDGADALQHPRSPVPRGQHRPAVSASRCADASGRAADVPRRTSPASTSSACEKAAAIDGELLAPLRPAVPALKPGETYLVETVVRTLKVGHPFTPGHGRFQRDLGRGDGDQRRPRRSAAAAASTPAAVDPWSHFINVFMLDREGNRIDRRNPQDIFVPLYNHQIPPGAAAVVHFGFDVPARHHGADHGRSEAAVPQVRHASS